MDLTPEHLDGLRRLAVFVMPVAIVYILAHFKHERLKLQTQGRVGNEQTNALTTRIAELEQRVQILETIATSDEPKLPLATEAQRLRIEETATSEHVPSELPEPTQHRMG